MLLQAVKLSYVCSKQLKQTDMKRILTCILLSALLLAFLPVRAWSPAGDRIKTRWAQTLTPENAWRSYPRPQLVRNQWQNLNGIWECAVTRDGQSPAAYDKEILVPFCIESSLSGLAETFRPEDRLWYKRSFTIDPSWKGQRIILHFGAVDYACEVSVNGKTVGTHKGGNNAFHFDITDALRRKGVNQLVVSVTDPTDTDTDTRGKQILNPKGIWYTAVSGIWKTVWIEPVPKVSFSRVCTRSDIAAGTVSFDIDIQGGTGAETVSIDILDQGKVLASYEGPADAASVRIPSPECWTPDSPKLYDLSLTLIKGGKVLDKADSYFAFREVGKMTDVMGHVRFTLNGEALFQYGPLDQGWWPDGLLTPPSEEAMLYDMQVLKKLGFNTIRKHIKVEPELYYRYADSLGFMIWQDMPSGFESAKANEQHVGARWPEDWDAPATHEAQWKYEYEEMVRNLRFFPCITTWVVFNEGWGQFRTAEMTAFAQSLDPDRIINSVTGWCDREVGDVLDIHNYPSTSMKLKDECGGRISILGEFGGLALPVPGHTWFQEGGWGYRNMDAALDLTNNYARLVYDLEALVAQGLSGAIYTQTTDVEAELNGFMTYDREVTKVNENLVNILHSRLYGVRPALYRHLVGRTPEGKIASIAPGESAVYEDRFNDDGEAGHLSLWLAANCEMKVWINGKEVFNGPVRQTRNYNQFNISNYRNYLRKGENGIRFEMKNTLPKRNTSFDYALTAY